MRLTLVPRTAGAATRSERVLEALGERTFPFALEIGAGDGALSERLALRCGRLITLEPSPAAAARARRRLRRFGNVDVRLGTVPGDLPAWTFDLVVWLDPDPAALEPVLELMPRGATLLTAAGAGLSARAGLLRVGATRRDALERFERRSA